MPAKQAHTASLPEPLDIQFFRERWNKMIPGSFARYEGVDAAREHAPIVTITGADGMKVLRFCGDTADKYHSVKAIAALLEGCREITLS